MNYLMVFLGGGLGSVCRYGIARWVGPHTPGFPMATMVANVLSCFILGLFVSLFFKNELPNELKLAVMVGFCGGFSTFSTFTSETFLLFDTGNFGFALLNIAGSLILCLISIYLGLGLGKQF